MTREIKEILSSCCAFGGGTEEVHVLESDCPINRKLGKREVEPFFKHEEKRTECTCIYISSFGGGIKPCENYQGVKKVQRNKRTKYKVLCGALENS